MVTGKKGSAGEQRFRRLKPVEEMTDLELIGFLPEEIRRGGREGVKLPDRVKEEEIRERMSNLRDAFMQLREVGYGDNFTSFLGGKIIAEMRFGKQLTLYPKSLDPAEGENVSFKEKLEGAMNSLSISWWPDKDKSGNDVYAIERARDIEIIRRLNVLGDDKIFQKQVDREPDLAKKAALRERRIKEREKLEKVRVEMENERGFMDDPNYERKTDPVSFMFAFGSSPVIAARLREEVTREFREGSNFAESVGEETQELVEEIARMDEEIMTGRSLEVEFLRERGDLEPLLPQVVDLYPEKFKWFPYEWYRAWCKENNVAVDTVKAERGKPVLINLESKSVVSRDEKEQIFRDAKDWESDDEEVRDKARNALADTLLINKNLVISLIKDLKSKDRTKFANISSDDLFQLGNVAILNCISRYDPSKSETGSYVTFLGNEIEHEMRRFRHVQWGQKTDAQQVSRPEHAEQTLRDIFKVERDLRRNNPHRAVDIAEVAREAILKGKIDLPEYIQKRAIRYNAKDDGFYVVAFELYMETLMRRYSEVHYDYLDSEDVKLTDINYLGQYLFTEPLGEDAATLNDLRVQVSRVLTSLTPREERVVRARWGIGAKLPADYVVDRFSPQEREEYDRLPPYEQIEYKERFARERGLYDALSEENATQKKLSQSIDGGSLEEVGRTFMVSKERVRQIEDKALRKLKHPARSRTLSSFLNPGASFLKTRARERKAELERLAEIARVIRETREREEAESRPDNL